MRRLIIEIRIGARELHGWVAGKQRAKCFRPRTEQPVAAGKLERVPPERQSRAAASVLADPMDAISQRHSGRRPVKNETPQQDSSRYRECPARDPRSQSQQQK